MRIHPGRAALAAVALAEVGAVVGALLAWLVVVGWALLRDWPPPPGVAVAPAALCRALLGAAVWAGLVAAPAGALALPLLGLTVLRRVPLGRAVGLPALGALLGLALGALLSPGPSAAPAGLAVPAPVPALAALGLLAGAAAARAGRRRALPGDAGRGAAPPAVAPPYVAVHRARRRGGSSAAAAPRVSARPRARTARESPGR